MNYLNANNLDILLGTYLREISLIIGLTAFLVALAGGAILTSFMCRLAWRFDVLDKPDGFLKCHSYPIPTLGGVPLFLAVVLGCLVLLVPVFILKENGFDTFKMNLSLGSLLVGSLIILTLGISDDLHHVMPRFKLLFQIMASMVLIGSGLVIRQFNLFGLYDCSLGVLAVPFTLFWLVGSCNAFNFIDGMDGLASGIGAVLSLFIAALGFINGAFGPAVIALALAGGLIGVLLFNLKPAMIFLGDSGSQTIGLLLATLTILVSSYNGSFNLPAAGILLSIPIIDTFFSILRRYSSMDSPAHGDHKHIHHCLRRLRLSVTQVSVTLWFCSFIAGGISILCCFHSGWEIALLAGAFVLAELYLGSRTGCLDLNTFTKRCLSNFRWKIVAKDQAKSSRGTPELLIFWDRMKPVFEQMHLDRAILTLEGTREDGQPDYETYKWVRSEEFISELLASRWTKRFPLGSDKSRIATLRLESAEHQLSDEQRIDWLLNEITTNMRRTSPQQTEINDLVHILDE